MGDARKDETRIKRADRRRALWFLAVVLEIATFAQTPSNLLSNGGFLAVESSVPADWTLPSSVAGQGTAAVAHDGTNDWLVLTPNGANPMSDQDGAIFGVSQRITANHLSGMNLYISALMSANAGATAVLRVYVGWLSGGVRYQEVRVEGPSANPVFRQDVVPVPHDPQVAFVLVLCAAEGKSGSVSFTNVSLTTTVPASWLEGNGSPDPGPAYQAETTIDAGAMIRTIPPTLYGSNLEWPFDGIGIWNSGANTADPTISALSRLAGFTLHRFPGGVFSDYYTWQSGIGPGAQRPISQVEPGGPSSPNHFGTDEALAFADATDANLLITVNIVTATAQDAANWVAHVEASGHRVQYWEIGNENYMPAGSALTPNQALTPEEYANRFLQFAQAMRKVDPTISIGAVADFNYAHTVSRANPEWTQRVFAIAANQIDFVAVHCGYAPVIFQDEQWAPRTVYSAMLAAPVSIRGNLAKLATIVASAVGPRAVPIAVTEWGPLFQFDTDGRFVDHPKTMASALFTASTLKTFIESSSTTIANYFKLNDFSGQGAIGYLNGLPNAKSNLLAMEMFTKYFGPNLVSSSTTGPVYDAPSVGLVDAVGGAPYLEIVNSTSADGNTLYLMAINKHLDRAIQTSIQLVHFAPIPKAAVFTLAGTAPDANTGTGWIPAPGLTTPQAEIAPALRFNLGSPSEVAITASTFAGASQAFTYVFPPHSITAIILTKQNISQQRVRSGTRISIPGTPGNSDR